MHNEFASRGPEEEVTKKLLLQLPRGTYRALKEAALRRKLSVGSLVRLAVEHELNFSSEVSRQGEHVLPSPTFLRQIAEDLNALLTTVEARQAEVERHYVNPDPRHFAHKFLQSLPIPVILKSLPGNAEEDASIYWCNQACEDLLGVPLEAIRGKAASAVLGLGEDDPSKMHVGELRNLPYTNRCERFKIRGSDVYLTAHRFIVTEPNQRGKYIGDVSFLTDELARSRLSRVPLKSLVVPPRVSDRDAHFCELVLSNFALVAVLKDAEQKIRWCNSSFARLANLEHPSLALGRTSTEIFGLPERNEITYYDSLAVASREASLGSEMLSDNGERRTAVHFPILNKNGEVEFIGVVSGEPPF